jgi:hypothetical protein
MIEEPITARGGSTLRAQSIIVHKFEIAGLSVQVEYVEGQEQNSAGIVALRKLDRDLTQSDGVLQRASKRRLDPDLPASSNDRERILDRHSQGASVLDKGAVRDMLAQSALHFSGRLGGYIVNAEGTRKRPA